MKTRLEGKTVAMLVTDGFEQVELTDPKEALEGAGATVHIIAPKADQVQGWKHMEKGDTFAVDVSLDTAKPDDYWGLVLPGGVINADHIRMHPKAVEFVRDFHGKGKMIAAICHGAWILIEADAVEGRRVTSYPSLKTDLCNAGAQWVDEEVVVDGQLITSRKPADLPAFDAAIVDALAKAAPVKDAVT
ncbi:MAG: type 1 glutamine amidotransferase domain-containing protein [Rhodoplanes sp.]